jgi:hypothetical protein
MAETCRSTAQFKIKWNFCEAIYITYYILVISKARGGCLNETNIYKPFYNPVGISLLEWCSGDL